MKQTILVLIALLAICNSCRKSSSGGYSNTATIKGYDYSATVCGGTYWIVIHGITDSLASFDSLPASSGIDLSTATFPLNIRLNWHLRSPDLCNVIVVDGAARMD